MPGDQAEIEGRKKVSIKMPGPIQAFLSPPSLVGALSRLATPIRFSERTVAMLAFECVVLYCYTHTNASREKKG
uniref:Uncharacterized protein n=1 Tax=Trichogramma kaykai TaxID=54128 RepID=A0ABD2VVD9_9HYME